MTLWDQPAPNRPTSHHRCDQSGSGRADAGGPIPGRPLLSFERRAHRTPSPAASKRGHPSAGGPVHNPLQLHLKDRQHGESRMKPFLCWMAHDWQGNIRELENAIEHAFILCREGHIDIRHLPEELRARGSTPCAFESDIRSAHDILDGQAIRMALEQKRLQPCCGSLGVGIHKTTLFRQMKNRASIPPNRTVAVGENSSVSHLL